MTTKLALTQRWKKNLSELLELSPKVLVPNEEALVSELSGVLESYLDRSSIQDIYDATLFGAEAHKGQKRKSGEDYIFHPIAVTKKPRHSAGFCPATISVHDQGDMSG